MRGEPNLQTYTHAQARAHGNPIERIRLIRIPIGFDDEAGITLAQAVADKLKEAK
jgi:allophanate hydrolase subunit 1